jgi:hypothetical protein
MATGNKFADASMKKIAAIENRLSGTLKPITPRREFVHGLGERIQSGSRAALVSYFTRDHILVLLIAGLVSIAVFLAMLVRALLIVSGKKRTA